MIKPEAGSDDLVINEIFFSIQGESSHAGRPCVFVRLTECDLRCAWCDTPYAFTEGTSRSVNNVLDTVRSFGCRLVEVTGGEPLLQPAVHTLFQRLCDEGFEVLVETGGHLDISGVDRRVQIVMDIKCPGSKMARRNRWENLDHLKDGDEVKFVIADRADYEWSRDVVRERFNGRPNTVLFSPVFGSLENRSLAEWIIQDGLPVRFQVQLHKYIWDPARRGV